MATAASSTPIIDAIHARRTIFEFKPDPVETETLLQILEAGLHGPNHHLTQPYRFTVLGGETKRILAERYREIQREKVAGVASPEQLEAVGGKGWKKWMSKPTIVSVSCRQEGDEQERREDYAAACCAMVNIQLAGWELGVGMQWTTGPITREDATYRLLGIDPEQEYIIGFYYMGYPAEIPQPKRKPLPEFLRWTP